MEEKSFFGKWSKAIKQMDLGKREPLWQNAIEYLVGIEAIDPTMSNDLSQEWIQEIFMQTSTREGTDDPYTSAIEVLDDFSMWFIGVKKDSLPAYVVTGKELWLLYLMLRVWDMVWDGDDWVKVIQETDIDEAFFEKFEQGGYDKEAPDAT